MSTPKCTYNIRTQLTSFAPGGTWTYVGYNANSDSGPWGNNPATPLVPELPGSVINRGDDFTIVTDGKSFGYYKFNYTIGSDTVSLTVRVIDDVITSGVSTSITLSTQDSPVDLLFILGGSPNGVWTDLDSAGGAFNSATNTLTPTTLTPGNTYRFKYSLTSGYAQGGCTSCPSLESTVTVSIVSGFSARVDVTDDTCVLTMALRNPDDNVANKAKVTIDADSLRPKFVVKRVVTDCNSLTLADDVVEVAAFTELIIGHNMSTVPSALQTGGFIETLTLTNSAGGTVTVPLAPSGANQAVFTGVGGSTTASALTFTSPNTTAYRNALEIAIRNSLGVQGFFINTHYRLFIRVDNVSGTGEVILGFFAKHQPSTAWLGYSSMLYRATSSSGTTSAGINYSFYGYSFIPATYSQLPCGMLSVLPAGSTQIIDTSLSTYNNIVLTGSTYVFTVDGSSVASLTCTSKRLQAVPLNCTGNATYLWDYKSATTSVIEVINKGTYKVTVTCSNPVGTKEVIYVYS